MSEPTHVHTGVATGFGWAAAVACGLVWHSEEIDTQKSVMTVRVFKSGLFSAFGHDHEISAPIRRVSSARLTVGRN